MCRNIKVLLNFEPPATDQEIMDAALQYVRKISGLRKPSKANEAVFNKTVNEIAANSKALLAGLVITSKPRDRETEASKARARSAARFSMQ